MERLSICFSYPLFYSFRDFTEIKGMNMMEDKISFPVLDLQLIKIKTV
jgi:hypothetical protein